MVMNMLQDTALTKTVLPLKCSRMENDFCSLIVGFVGVNVEINDHNVILWMDHRALDQAKRINETDHRVLRNVGGIISPEMQLPKLLWLKQVTADSEIHFYNLLYWGFFVKQVDVWYKDKTLIVV